MALRMSRIILVYGVYLILQFMIIEALILLILQTLASYIHWRRDWGGGGEDEEDEKEGSPRRVEVEGREKVDRKWGRWIMF